MSKFAKGYIKLGGNESSNIKWHLMRGYFNTETKSKQDDRKDSTPPAPTPEYEMHHFIFA